jgi:hypothetical protein
MPAMIDWNATRFDPASARGHVESHFLKLNDAAGRRALWLKATILKRIGRPPVAEAWAVAFDRGLGHAAAKQVVPWESASFARAGLAIRVADVAIGPTSTRGALAADGGAIEWDLAFAGDATPFAPLPQRLYADDTGNSKIVSPHPDLRFTGHYRVGDRRVAVDGWRGMQGHNWGPRHTYAYAWLHANVWRAAEDLVVEGICARVKVGPLLAPPVTMLVVQHAGERHLFTLPGSLWRARGSFTTRAWQFRAANRSAEIRGRFAADTADFVGLHYENPDGAMTYCLNSKIARGSLRLAVAGRSALEAQTDAAALENATRDPDHGVRMLA